MAKINFYLKDKAATQSTLIYAFLSADGKRYKVSTGQSLHPRYWNAKKQRVKNSLPGQKPFNHHLDKIGYDLEVAYHELRESGQAITSAKLKDAIRPAEEETGVKLKDAILLFMEQGEAEGKAYNTIRNYKGFLNHIKDFEATNREKLTFDSIDPKFENRFVSHLIKKHQSSQTNIAKQFSILKAFMSWAKVQGYHDTTAYQNYSQKEKPATKVALTEEELTLLASCDLSNRPGLERVRDMFLFCCETSLRYSDLANLKPLNVITKGQDKYLRLSMMKTRGKIDGALLEPLAARLISKFEDPERKTCFPVISGQKMNDYIKEACQIAGIDTAVQSVRFIGSKRIEESIPKYKLVSMHTARRTFVTIRINWGWTDRQIMVYTGHQSTKEITAYRDKSPEANLITAKEAPRPKHPRFMKVG